MRTVAVLPFVNHGPDMDAEYLADGLAEELIDRLGMVPAMRVVARTSAFQFKGQNRDMRAIGEALGAKNLVEGSVRKASGRVRITCQLQSSLSGASGVKRKVALRKHQASGFAPTF